MISQYENENENENQNHLSFFLGRRDLMLPQIAHLRSSLLISTDNYDKSSDTSKCDGQESDTWSSGAIFFGRCRGKIKLITSYFWHIPYPVGL